MSMVPRTNEAPGLFSTTNATFICVESCCVRILISTSTEPPAADGRTKRMGFSGYAAWAVPLSRNATKRDRKVRIALLSRRGGEAMSTRREFIAGAIAFVGCELFPNAHAQTQRRQVSVGGRRIKTIDVHAHCIIPEAVAMMKQKPNPVYAGSMAERIKRMDEQGIDMQALSINPTWYALERDMAEKVIQLQNEKLAELCAQHPDRFVAFATVALQHPDLAARQL